MNGDSNKQDLAWARLAGLRTRPRSDWGEQEIRDYQEIVYSLEAAYGTDLSAFGIPNDRVKRKPVTYQRAPRSGRFGAHVQYSNNALCEADFVQQQLEGLVAYIGTLRTPRALSTDRTAEIDGITKGELLKSKPEEIRRSLAPAHAVIASIRPVLAWTQSQIERIAAIELNLVMNLNAHETMHEFWEPGEWIGAGPNRFDQLTEVRKLERDIRRYLSEVLNVLAEVSLSASSTEELRLYIENGTAALLSATIARVNKKDFPFLDVDAINNSAKKACFFLIQRAVARFEILQNPKPLVGNTVESNFMFEEYPKVKYHWTKKEVTVKDVNAELALGGGWADTPADFAPYRGPHVASADQDAVTKWADDWRGDTLTPEVRRKIRAQLLRADAAFWEAPEKESADWAAMRLAFDGIAKVLFEAGILTGEDLESVIPTLVWDSAIAGGWYRLASHSPKNIYPERLGHYFVWRDETKNWNALFRAEQGRWRAELLDNPLEARLDQEPSMPMPSRGSTGDSGVGEPRVNQERGAHGVNREILDFTSEAGRISAVKGYVDFWAAQTGSCSEASLARAARVHPSDLSKWKKTRLPGSEKAGRIEDALTNKTPPVLPDRAESETR